jgi:hypothetical protein
MREQFLQASLITENSADFYVAMVLKLPLFSIENMATQ